MKFCKYMDSDWFNALQREVGASNKTRVAQKMGVSRSTLSAIVNGLGEYGKGTASTTNFEREFRRAYEQLECPHTGTKVGTVYCRENALCAAPTHNPLQMMHWQACQSCSNKPRPVRVAAPASVGRTGKATSGTEASDEGWNCIGGPMDNPYPEQDQRHDYWAQGFQQRREFDRKQRDRLRSKHKEEVQQAGIIDKVTLSLPEVGGPQIATEQEAA